MHKIIRFTYILPSHCVWFLDNVIGFHAVNYACLIMLLLPYPILLIVIVFLIADVSSIALCSSQQFCSVGDDSCLILWDARIGTDPVVKVSWTFLVICIL